MRRYIGFVIPALLLVTCIVQTGVAQEVILGVLEEVPGVHYKEPSSRHVRVVFRSSDGNWEAFPGNCPDVDCLNSISKKFPDEINWTISFDGRYIGRVTARTQNRFAFYSHVGLQNITGNGPVPTVGSKSRAYGGYPEAMVYRPLVANSEPHFRDPESWKPTQLDNAALDSLRRAFRSRSPKLCRQNKQDLDKLERFPYRDKDIRLIKAYSSNKRWSIAQLRLETAINCENVEAGFEMPDQWFTIDPNGAARYLDQAMWLVDAGDYDNDGRSELIFSIDDENKGGYKIFYDDFNKSATFEYNYH